LKLFGTAADEQKRKELLDKVDVELKRINEILTDFLNISKPSGQPVLQPIHFAEVIEELEFLLKGEANLKKISLVYSCPQEFPRVKGDKNGLKQVFLNIAKNAIEACPKDKGILEISMHRDAKNAWITFKDNGPGIPSENMPKVLRPFFTTKKRGTGLGLAISSSIIKRMGGELRIESQPGCGTAVHVILPLM